MVHVPRRFFPRGVSNTGGFGWCHDCPPPAFLVGETARIFSMADADQNQRATWFHVESDDGDVRIPEGLRRNPDQSVSCEDFHWAHFGENGERDMIVGQVYMPETNKEMRVVIWREEPCEEYPDVKVGRLEWTVEGIDWPEMCLCGRCNRMELNPENLCPLFANFEPMRIMYAEEHEPRDQIPIQRIIDDLHGGDLANWPA